MGESHGLIGAGATLAGVGTAVLAATMRRVSCSPYNGGDGISCASS